MKLGRGVRQGGPEAPILYVLAFARSLKSGAEARMAECPVWNSVVVRSPHYPDSWSTIVVPDWQEASEVDLTELAYADDVMGHYVFVEPVELSNLISLWRRVLLRVQKDFNIGKIEICIFWGSRSQAKQYVNAKGLSISDGSTIDYEVSPARRGHQTEPKLPDGYVRIVKDLKHLGSLFTRTFTSTPAVNHRLTAASTAYGRLTKRVWHRRDLPMPLRSSLYSSLARSVAIYSLHIRVLNGTDLGRLERWQMKRLRHIANKPAHLTHFTNAQVRSQMKVPTIESFLRRLRLGMFRTILRFPECHVATIAAVWGVLPWEQSSLHTDRLQIFRSDLETLQRLHRLSALKNWVRSKDGGATRRTRQEPDRVDLDDAPTAFRFLAEATDQMLNHVLSYNSVHDPAPSSPCSPSSVGSDRPFVCEICGDSFFGRTNLTTHMWAAHKVQDPVRALVKGPWCPACGKPFQTKHGAKEHLQKLRCEEADEFIARELERLGVQDPLSPVSTSSSEPLDSSTLISHLADLDLLDSSILSRLQAISSSEPNSLFTTDLLWDDMLDTSIDDSPEHLFEPFWGED